MQLQFSYEERRTVLGMCVDSVRGGRGRGRRGGRGIRCSVSVVLSSPAPPAASSSPPQTSFSLPPVSAALSPNETAPHLQESAPARPNQMERKFLFKKVYRSVVD